MTKIRTALLSVVTLLTLSVAAYAGDCCKPGAECCKEKTCCAKHHAK